MSNAELENVLHHFYNIEMIAQDLGSAVHAALNSWIDRNDVETDKISNYLKQLNTELDAIEDCIKSKRSFLEKQLTSTNFSREDWYFVKRETLSSRAMTYGKGRAKTVKCIETGQVFPSSRAASRWLGFSDSAVSRAIKDKITAGGYHWEYIDDNQDGVYPL